MSRPCPLGVRVFRHGWRGEIHPVQIAPCRLENAHKGDCKAPREFDAQWRSG